jgi:glycosyltransferase involved in cell wall biosynthesis
MSTNISRSIIEEYGCPPEKVICAYCGSNIQPLSFEEVDEGRYSRANILFVGVDCLRKGGHVLAEAFKKVLLVYPDATLTIVGCSPQLNIPNCTIVGKIPLQDVKKYYKQATVFCMPTLLEPFGIVFLEAMAFKLPVIGTNIGAIPDFIQNGLNGYVIEPDNSDKLADCLIDLLGKPEKCRAFGENSYRLFLNRYTWEKTGQLISNNIKEVLN